MLRSLLQRNIPPRRAFVLSLSGGSGFTLISVPDGKGGSVAILGGACQMAIANPLGGPMARNIAAVEFVALDPSTYFRELVVSGTPSQTPLSPAPSAPGNV